MTAQISDSFIFEGRDYAIAGKKGTGLFDPTLYDMTPVGRCSSCWRGFVCTYAIEEQHLILDRLEIHLDKPAPPLFGVQPVPQSSSSPVFDAVYENLQHHVSYTGGLLLARDFIQELYVHMGFHPAWKYREVHELIFKDGRLIEHTDCTERMAELRRKLAQKPLGPEKNTGPKIRRWIGECFSEDYEL